MAEKQKRGEVCIPETWTKFKRTEIARMMIVYAFEGIAPNVFMRPGEHKILPRIMEATGHWSSTEHISKEAIAALRETAKMQDEGKAMKVKVVEDPRDIAEGYGGYPTSCPYCDEYDVPIPDWCRFPHSDGMRNGKPIEKKDD